MRKSVQVAALVDEANRLLAIVPREGEQFGSKVDAQFRQGVIAMLEHVLHETGNYRGFRYLDGHEAVARDEYDETRRAYSA